MEDTLAQTETQIEQKQHLKKILGVSFGIAITIGGTIGVGILRTPGIVAAKLGSTSLIMLAWIIGGIYSLFGTLSSIELSTSIPKAGGWYVFVRRAFGSYWGFLIGWSDWIANCATLASIALAICEFAALIFPDMQPIIKVTAVILILAFASIQWIGLRSGSRTQELTSLIKALIYIAFIAACFIWGGGKAPAASNSITPSLSIYAIFAGSIIAFQSIIFAYDGWYNIIYFSEEDKDPSRNLPRSAIGGVLITIFIYLLVNAGLLYVLPLSKLASSIAPATDAAQVIFGSKGSKIITILSIIALISVLNAVLLIATRIIFGLGRDGLFTKKITTVSESGTPRRALLLTVVFILLLIASGSVEVLIAVSAFFYVANYFLGFSSLVHLRKKEPDLQRPFKTWGYPVTTLIFLVGSLLFLIGDIFGDPVNALFAFIFIVVTFPAYKLVARINKI